MIRQQQPAKAPQEAAKEPAKEPAKEAGQQAPAQKAYMASLGKGGASRPRPKPEPEKKKEEEGGWFSKVGGWFSDAADWVGEKYEQAKDAVVETWETVKEVSKDVYQAVTSTSLSYKDGKLKGSTDVGEVMDLMPGGWQSALQFDNAAKGGNQVSIELDLATKVVTVRSAKLTLTGINWAPLVAGQTDLLDVVIVLSNPNGGTPIVDSTTDNLTGQIRIGSVRSTAVDWNAGQLTVQSLTLNGLVANAANPSGGVPLMDGTPDQMVGSFFVDSVNFDGVGGTQIQADNLSGAGLRGGGAQKAEAGWLEVDQASGENVTAGGNSVAAASLTGLKAHGSAKGGDLSQFSGGASLQSASVSGAETAQGSVESASVTGLSGTADLPANRFDGRLESASVQGAQTERGGGSLEVQGLEAKRNAAGTSVALASARGEDLRWDDAQAKTLAVDGARGSTGKDGPQASVDRVGGTGLSYGAHSVDELEAQKLKASRGPDGDRASLAALEAKGLKSGESSADSVALSTLALSRGAEAQGTRTRASVESAQASGVKAGGAEVKQAELHGVQGSMLQSGGKTSVDGGVARAHVEGLKGEGYSATGVHALDLKGSATLQGEQIKGQASAGELHGRGVQVGETRADKVGLHGVSGTYDQDSKGRSGSAKVASGSVGTLTTGAGEVQGAEFSELSASGWQSGTRTSGSVDLATLSAEKGQLSGTDFTGASATGLHAQGSRAKGTTTAKASADRLAVGSASSEQFSVTDGRLTGLKASGSSSGEHQKASASFVGLEAEHVKAAGGEASGLSVQGASATGERGGEAGTRGSARISGLSADALAHGDASAQKVSITDVGGQGKLGASGLEGQAWTSDVEAEQLKYGALGSAETFRSRGLSAGRQDGVTTGRVADLEAKGVESKWGSADRVALNTTEGSYEQTDEGMKGRLDANLISVDGADGMGMKVGQLRARETGVGYEDGAIETRSRTVQLNDVERGALSAKSGELHGAHTRHAEGVHSGGFDRAGVDELRWKEGRYDATIDRFEVEKADARVEGGETQATLGRASADDVEFAVAGRDLNAPVSSEEGFLSTGDVVQGLASRIDDVDAKFSAPMRAGAEIGRKAEVEKDTRMDVNVRARNNVLDPSASNVKFSEGLDGPLWTELDGVYLERAEDGPRDHGTVSADVAGWGDQDLTGSINKELGREGETVPLNLTELATAARPAIDGTRPVDRAPKKKDEASGPSPIDMSGYSLDATARLSGGELNLGESGMQQLELREGEKPTDNVMKVKGAGGEDLVFSMVNMLLGRMQVNVASHEASAEQANLKDAEVAVGEDAKGATTFKGRIGRLEAMNLGLD